MGNVTDLLVETIAQRVAALLKPALEQRDMRPRLLTLEQAGIYLGRTTEAVRSLHRSDAFPVVRADTRVMLDVEDLDRWIEQNKV